MSAEMNKQAYRRRVDEGFNQGDFAGVDEHWAVTDNLGMMQQLGIIAAPGQPAEAHR